MSISAHATLVRGPDGLLYSVGNGAASVVEGAAERPPAANARHLATADADAGRYFVTPGADADAGRYFVTPGKVEAAQDADAGRYFVTPGADADAGRYFVTPGKVEAAQDADAGRYFVTPGAA